MPSKLPATLSKPYVFQIKVHSECHHLNQWWLDYHRIYATLGLIELMHIHLGMAICFPFRKSSQIIDNLATRITLVPPAWQKEDWMSSKRSCIQFNWANFVFLFPTLGLVIFLINDIQVLRLCHLDCELTQMTLLGEHSFKRLGHRCLNIRLAQICHTIFPSLQMRGAWYVGWCVHVFMCFPGKTKRKNIPAIALKFTTLSNVATCNVLQRYMHHVRKAKLLKHLIGHLCLFHTIYHKMLP